VNVNAFAHFEPSKHTLIYNSDICAQFWLLVKIPALRSTQEGTDSRVILYCIFAREKGFQYDRVRVQIQTYYSFCYIMAPNFCMVSLCCSKLVKAVKGSALTYPI